MTERKTKQITLPMTQTVITMYEWITAGEVSQSGKEEDPTKYMLETLITDVNGSKENIYKTLMDLPYQDYKVIDNELLIIAGLGDKKKPVGTSNSLEEKES